MLKLFADSTRVNSKFGLKDDPADEPSTYRRYRLPFRRGNRQWIHQHTRVKDQDVYYAMDLFISSFMLFFLFKNLAVHFQPY